ncbi:MAG TPA: hypothetical protein VGS98_03330 [Thermoanaerobaculia bacterium]|jgi:transcriptional regulator with XRE-family HTH domain|nr:hypothetical protein [Thermoanaerobaculia bacterium]
MEEEVRDPILPPPEEPILSVTEWQRLRDLYEESQEANAALEKQKKKWVPEIQGVRARARAAEEKLDAVAKRLGVPIDEFLSHEDEQADLAAAAHQKLAGAEDRIMEAEKPAASDGQLYRRLEEAERTAAVAAALLDARLDTDKPRTVLRMLTPHARLEAGSLVFRDEDGSTKELAEILPAELVRSRGSAGSGGATPKEIRLTTRQSDSEAVAALTSQRAYDAMTPEQKRAMFERLARSRG